jgi:1-acyl-sn-glycerol-3-phosphate acyltransferase
MNMRIAALRPNGGKSLTRLLWVFGWGTISVISAFAPLAVLNLLQFPSLLLLPFSRRAYRSYNEGIALLVWGWWAWSAQNIVGLRVRISGDPLPMREDAIIFSNHQSMSDVVVIMCLALRQGRISATKWMVKDIVKYVPGVGWGMVFLNCVFLKRNWAADEANIRSTFRTYVEERLPLWLVSFPEGTRITPGKLKASQEYARKAGIPPTERVMLPRSKGFAAEVIGLRETVRAVYSVTIGYPDNRIPSLLQVIRGEIDDVDVHVRRYPIGELARDEAGLSAWLVDRFREMDQRLSAGPPTTALTF